MAGRPAGRPGARSGHEDRRTSGEACSGSRRRPTRARNSDIRTTALSSRGMLPWPVAPVATARSQAMPFSATWIG